MEDLEVVSSSRNDSDWRHGQRIRIGFSLQIDEHSKIWRIVIMRSDVERIVGDHREHVFACEACYFESNDLLLALDHAETHIGDSADWYIGRLIEICWWQHDHPTPKQDVPFEVRHSVRATA
jgi:hypothetical protein